jgi:hypothetical protein
MSTLTSTSAPQHSDAEALSGDPRRLHGHRDVKLGASPFAATLPGVVTAVAFGVASLVWLAAGDHLPGGRWIVVHLFTLGVLTPLICTFTQHFAARFTGTVDLLPRRAVIRTLTALLALAVVVLVTGRITGDHVLLAGGSLGVMAIVAWNLVVLGRLRRAAVTTRFAWVVRRYQHAHVAFLFAAALGGAMGAGWIPGQLFGPVREAHIHLNVLGWAGLTVLATLVVFGPAMLRVRMEPQADVRAQTALQIATFGLVVAVVGFVIASLGDGAPPAVLLAAGGLAAYGYGVGVVCRPLIRACRGSDRSPLRWAIMASATWFLFAITADVVTVAAGRPGWSHGLAPALLIGMLAQLVLAVLLFVTPMLRGRDLSSRDRLIARVERGARTRTAALNLGVVVLVSAQAVGQLSGLSTTPVSRVGWFVVGSAIAAHLIVLLWPTGTADPDQVASATAARYRTAT